MTAPGRRSARLSADERRKQILRSARVVFTRSGLAGARTRDIAAEAGINEAMLYRHFPSKEELFEAAVAQPLEDAVAALVESAGTAPTEFSSGAELQRQQTRQFVYELYGVMEEIAPLLGVVLFAEAETARRYYTERIKPSLDKIKAIVEANSRSWPHRDFDAGVAVEQLFGTTWFMATADNLTGVARDRDQVADQIVTAFMDGLLLPGGSAG